ncbi:MAG: Asp-tRNA(Asn)/Glu-tRNA(Gln) amidotransferase subunit GatB, partial [Actinomyces sp.]
LRTRCEIKNINSVRSLGRAIDYEARRHVELYEAGERPVQETRHWHEDEGRTTSGRSKEEAEDYRYFPEPDLVPLVPSAAEVAAIDASLPALPARRRAVLAEAAGVAPADVAVLVDRGQDTFALAAIAEGADPARVLVRIENDLAVDDWSRVSPAAFAALVSMETSGELTASQARTVLAEMVAGGGDPAAIAARLGFEAMDTGELEAVVEAVIATHPDEWARFVGGDDKDRKKMAGFFTGQVMKATRGQADGRLVAEILGRRAGG